MSRRRDRGPLPAPDAAVLTVVVLGAVAAAAALALARRVRAARAPDSFRCACGQTFRVSGRDRHRVPWPAGAPEDEPVLGASCPECGRALPHGTARAAA